MRILKGAIVNPWSLPIGIADPRLRCTAMPSPLYGI